MKVLNLSLNGPVWLTLFREPAKNGKYSLTVDYWSRTDGLEPHHGYLWEYECENLDERLKAFEEAKIFDGKTIYEIEADIHVLWG